MAILSDIISKLIGKVDVNELNLYWLVVICKFKRKLDSRFKVTQNDTPHYSDSVAQVPSCQSEEMGLQTKFPSTISKLCISQFILLKGFWDLEKCFNSERIEIPQNLCISLNVSTIIWKSSRVNFNHMINACKKFIIRYY